jgi:heme-degrading monooxygenase HmoA
VPGLRAARLLHPDEARRGYLSILEFTDEAAYVAYRASDSFRAAHRWPDHAPIEDNRLSTYQVRTEITATAAG